MPSPDFRPQPDIEHLTAEERRIHDNAQGRKNWYRWGPYLSDRQWGTVREDYSERGEAWEYITHERSRSVAYRWGEDGLAGFSDDHSRICLALALWNEQDPILKERMFGLTNHEGNHGEDVKEIYYYLDGTPSHSYLKMLYKYTQHPFPYQKLIQDNAARGLHDLELDLTETGLFDDQRYFDVFIEYAKADTDDICMRITAQNRGPDVAPLHILPQLWFRDTWSWKHSTKPRLTSAGLGSVLIHHPEFPEMELCYEVGGQLLFTDNKTNPAVWGQPSTNEYYKDAFHRAIVDQHFASTTPNHDGTKVGILYHFKVAPRGTATVNVRLRPTSKASAFEDFDRVFEQRIREADEFYSTLQAGIEDEDRRRVHRQAMAGLVWTKQHYYFDVEEWLEGDPGQPPPPAARKKRRNADWRHLNNDDIISMPDKWEYPWYAAWDLAFHCIPLALMDPYFAKEQLRLLLREWYMHPNGQMPAYEWNFSDVNPPVHAWACWRVYEIEQELTGKRDIAFLEEVFHKLMLNFTWWVNRKDAEGHNVFQGGFLGLDNIGVFDRSKPLPTGGYLSQADGTAWMAMFCLNLLRIALELALENPVYENIATKFFEHFLLIASAMTNIGDEGIGLWDPQDEFYYDVLNIHTHEGERREFMRLRSLVGLIPLFAVEVIEPERINRLPGFKERLEWVLEHRPKLAALVSRWYEPGRGERRLLSLLREHRMRCLLRRMLDPDEFLSDFGIRGVSKIHAKHPYILDWNGQQYRVGYTPGESDSFLFGGNSNWRGPIWMPINYLIIESLYKFDSYYGDGFTIECPTHSGNYLTLEEIADFLSERLCRIFLTNRDGVRPVYGHSPCLQNDPHFRDYVLFYEYFHGDTGRGAGASHQTGWTALVAKLLQPGFEPGPKPSRTPSGHPRAT